MVVLICISVMFSDIEHLYCHNTCCWCWCFPWRAAHQASLSFTISWSCSNPCPLSWWCHPTISSSVIPFSSCLQSFPASGSFPMSQLFTSGGQSIGASASASVLPVNISYSICLSFSDLFHWAQCPQTVSMLLQMAKYWFFPLWLSSFLQGFPGSSASKQSACNAKNPSLIPGSGRCPEEAIVYPLQYSWAPLVAQMVKNLPAMGETWVRPLGWEDPLEEGMATHASTVAWRTPMDRGSWQTTVHGSQSGTWLSNSAQHCFLQCVSVCVYKSHLFNLLICLWTQVASISWLL